MRMLNMSNQFYDYLSSKLLNYFDENNLLRGDRFFISFNEDQHVEYFYESLKKIGSSEFSCSDFSYIHEVSKKKYETFSIEINGIKLVVSESLSINDNYLVTLRNKVTSQKGDWENTALLIICKDSIDSINKGMKDLQKKGMPLNIKSISNNLEEEIESRDFDEVDKAIVNFALDILEEDIFQTTLWDYETILSIINNGAVSDEDLRELHLFKDEQLNPDLSPKNMEERLIDNHKVFDDVNKLVIFDERDKLKKMFTTPGVKLLSRDDWYQAKWKEVKKYKDAYDKLKKPLNYIESQNKKSENGLTFWERPNSFSGRDGQRTRHIIVFNENSSSEVSLKFSFDRTLKPKYVHDDSKDICEARGKSLFINFSVDSNEPTFKWVRYKHRDQNNSNYLFRIAVLNIAPEMIESIKSRYKVNKKEIEVTIDDDSFDIEFGVESSEKNYLNIDNEGETVYLYDNLHITISEESPIWVNEKFKFNLYYKNNSIPFLVRQKHDPPNPRKSYFIWNLKRKNQENFIFNGKTVVQDVNSFALYPKFKEYLKMEEEIIEKRIFYAKRNIDGSLQKEDVSYSKDLEDAYLDILNYYHDYDNSLIDNLPSLFYLNDELKEKYEKFIDIFNKEISEIEPSSILSDLKDKKDLLKLGRIDEDNKIMYTPLSPLNIAYQLEIDKQCKNEDFPINISERLVPNNLIPYIYSDNGDELFRPIYQDDAQEWIIYKKSEQVSIGTTNVFISDVVHEKLTQFVKHFSYLFSFNSTTPIKINLVNIKDDKKVVKGIFDFVRSRLPDKLKTKNVIPVEINIYGGSEKTYFDELFDCQSVTQLDEEFGIKERHLKSNMFDAIDIIHMVQDNISYYKHQSKNGYEYAHISFFKVESQNDTSVEDNMDKVETGLSLNGLLSSVSSTARKSGYRLGFGTKNILNDDNLLVKTVINLNELAENSQKGGKGSYSKKLSISTVVELDGDNIEELTEKSHWVTFIEPTFGLEYFDTFDDDLIIIHYSDQYSSSNKYDTITVTNKSTQYEEIIRDFLRSKNVKFSNEINKELNDVIKIFNAINGEWLLRIISNSEIHYDREKLSIISAIKYCLAILDHEDIVWIPVSMEEILRIAKNVKLNRSEGIFAELLKGSYSDDLLFIGVKFNDCDKIEVIFYPIEVKIGQNKSGTMKKGKNQLENTYKLLKTQLRKINNEDSEFICKFNRNFFIQLLLSNQQKLVVNHIWDEKGFDRIDDVKDKLLNDDYEIIFGLEDYVGIGSLFSFKEDSHHGHIYKEGNKQVIELPKDYAYPSLIAPIEEIHNKIQSDNTDIHAGTLLSRMDISDIMTGNDILGDLDDDVEIQEDNEDSDDIDEINDELTGDIVPDEVEEIEEEENDSNDEIESNEGDDKSSSNVRALIGTQKGYPHKVYWEFGHPDLGNRHMSIQGKSGQGKSYFIQRMLKELSNQGIPSIIIDYTDGFKQSKLEPEFKKSLEDRIVQHKVLFNKFPLNPFKKYLIEDDEEFVPELDYNVAGRFKNIVNNVYNFGDQQQMAIYNAALTGISKYGDEMDLTKFKEELIKQDSPQANSTLNKLTQFLDINPFKTDDFDWSCLDEMDGKIRIIQLTGLPRDIQIIVSEFILLDLWNYKLNTGDEDNPFIVVLDEAHNLDFGSDAPCGKILKEGRKFGWSGWFATQSMKGSMRPDEIANLANAEEKIYFHPTDVSTIAKELSKDAEDRKRLEKELSQLNKGYCIVQGSTIGSNGKLYHSRPLTVKIDKITAENHDHN